MSANMLPICVDTGKDFGGFALAEFTGQPSVGVSTAFAIIASHADRQNIFCNGSRTCRGRKWNEVFYAQSLIEEKPLRISAVGTAAMPIRQSIDPLFGGEYVRDGMLTSTAAMFCGAPRIWVGMFIFPARCADLFPVVFLILFTALVFFFPVLFRPFFCAYRVTRLTPGAQAAWYSSSSHKKFRSSRIFFFALATGFCYDLVRVFRRLPNITKTSSFFFVTFFAWLRQSIRRIPAWFCLPKILRSSRFLFLANRTAFIALANSGRLCCAFAFLALILPTSFMRIIKREKISGGRKPLLALIALYNLGIWDTIIHDVSSLLASVRAGVAETTPGFYMGSTGVIIPQIRGIV